MSSNHAAVRAVDGWDGHYLDRPWEFALWNCLEDADPEWVLRGFWYGGHEGSFVVVSFRYIDEPPYFSGQIVRFEQLVHAEREFAHRARSNPDCWGSSDGVYLFDRSQLLRHEGITFSACTGLRELPDNRW